MWFPAEIKVDSTGEILRFVAAVDGMAVFKGFGFSRTSLVVTGEEAASMEFK